MRSLRGPSSKAVGGLFGRWNEAVGEQVAQHVKPIKLDGAVLVVEVDDPAWATQVKFLTAMITERLLEVAQVKVERIDVRVDKRGRAAFGRPERGPIRPARRRRWWCCLLR